MAATQEAAVPDDVEVLCSRIPGSLPDWDEEPSWTGKRRSTYVPTISLPNELLEEVLTYLEPADLKSLRLVCSQLERVAARPLFRAVRFLLEPHVIPKLVGLAQHPIYSRYVREMELQHIILGAPKNHNRTILLRIGNNRFRGSLDENDDKSTRFIQMATDASGMLLPGDNPGNKDPVRLIDANLRGALSHILGVLLNFQLLETVRFIFWANEPVKDATHNVHHPKFVESNGQHDAFRLLSSFTARQLLVSSNLTCGLYRLHQALHLIARAQPQQTGNSSKWAPLPSFPLLQRPQLIDQEPHSYGTSFYRNVTHLTLLAAAPPQDGFDGYLWMRNAHNYPDLPARVTSLTITGDPGQIALAYRKVLSANPRKFPMLLDNIVSTRAHNRWTLKVVRMSHLIVRALELQRRYFDRTASRPRIMYFSDVYLASGRWKDLARLWVEAAAKEGLGTVMQGKRGSIVLPAGPVGLEEHQHSMHRLVIEGCRDYENVDDADGYYFRALFDPNRMEYSIYPGRKASLWERYPGRLVFIFYTTTVLWLEGLGALWMHCRTWTPGPAPLWFQTVSLFCTMWVLIVTIAMWRSAQLVDRSKVRFFEWNGEVKAGPRSGPVCKYL